MVHQIGEKSGLREISESLYFSTSYIFVYLRHAKTRYKSLFNQSTTTYVDSLWDFVPDFTEYSDLDKAAIRIMYDREVAIDPGLTRQKFDRMIAQAKKEMKR